MIEEQANQQAQKLTLEYLKNNQESPSKPSDCDKSDDKRPIFE